MIFSNITYARKNNSFQMSKAFFFLVAIASGISQTGATCHDNEIGDLMEGQVLDHPTRPCQRYICQNDTLITVNSGCVFNGTCYRIDSEWQSGCQTYKCDVKFKNNTVWYISEVKTPQCTDINGNCHGSGDTFAFNCTGIPCDCTCATDTNPVRYRCQVPNVK
ncbi:Hypothetical predicted protein [Mytilus galloprovincialis]|uniref:Uncharacterized protein n=1 Tax=Mytilus galloprovincialis TaxID=29158 RepID=A0A8B6HJI7_MYTGA|nr:Hypothetical predicted protein [Mytilus galloprovincialis]